MSPTDTLERPHYAPIPRWCAMSGMGRSKTYDHLGRGDLRAVKVGNRTLIDVAHGLTWMASLPQAEIAPSRKREAA